MRAAEFNPKAIAETIEAIWSSEDHVLEISNPGTDDVLITIAMVMSAEHARQCLAAAFGEFAQYIPFTVD